jgi:hypothetical protein
VNQFGGEAVAKFFRVTNLELFEDITAAIRRQFVNLIYFERAQRAVPQVVNPAGSITTVNVDGHVDVKTL